MKLMTVSQISFSAFSGVWVPDRAAVPVSGTFRPKVVDSSMNWSILPLEECFWEASFVIAIAVAGYEKEGPKNRWASMFCVTVSYNADISKSYEFQ